MTPSSATSLLKALPAAALLGVISLVMSFSFAALLTQGSNSLLLPAMVKALVFTAALAALILAWKGSIHGLIAIPLPSAVAMFADLFQRIQPSPEYLWTLLLLGSLMTAALMLVMGKLHLSRLVRYLPLPVLAGFLAGVGWLFIKGGLSVVDVQGWSWQPWTASAVWISLAFAGCLWLLKGKVKPVHLLPSATLIAGLLLVVMAPFWGTQTSWFFQLNIKGELPLTAWQWAQEGWPQVNWLHLPWDALATLAVIATLSMLLQATSVELLVKKDLDLDRELRTAGGLNLMTALAGGSVGSLSLSQTSMARQLNAGTRLTGFLLAAFLVLGYLFHEQILRWLPLPLVAGLLIFQGMQFVHQWLLTAPQRFPKSDQLVIAAIFVAIVFQGFLSGVLLGLLLTLLLFIREYGRLQVVQFKGGLDTFRSSVERTPDERLWLDKLSGQVSVYQLKGFLFFGTANTLVEEIQSEMNLHQGQLGVLLLDFQRVSNADSSAANNLIRLNQFCDERGVELHLASLKPDLMRRFKALGLAFSDASLASGVVLHESLDLALERIENTLLEHCPVSEQGSIEQLVASRLDFTEQQTASFLNYFSSRHFAAGEWILEQGSQETTLYLICSGQVEVLLPRGELPALRLKKMQPGNLLGEMGLYTGKPRTASARAVGPVHLLAMSAEQFQQMEAEDPQMALHFHRFVVVLQSERLHESNFRLNNIMKN